MIQAQSDIPSQYAELYRDYVECLKGKLPLVMWIVLDNGHRIMQIEKDKHKAMVANLLRSGDAQRVRVAEEVMMRSIGNWRIR